MCAGVVSVAHRCPLCSIQERPLCCSRNVKTLAVTEVAVPPVAEEEEASGSLGSSLPVIVWARLPEKWLAGFP